MIKRVTKDFETRSQCDLRKAGAYKYSLHPTTQPTCLAFKILGHSTVYFLNFEMVNRQWKDLPENLRSLWKKLIDEDYEFSAHNSFFERCIYDNILVKRLGWPKIPPRMRRCTAAKAASCALPRNLEGAGEALKLRIQKDKRGYVAMMKTCKPTKQYNEWQKIKLAVSERLSKYQKLTPKQQKWYDSGKTCPPMFLEPDADPDTWNTLYTYCKIDVRAEEAVDQALPDLIPSEQEIWHLNQMLNWRGLRIDLPTVKKIVGIIETESKVKLKELDSLTMGLVTKPGARKSILEFLALEGIELPDLKSKTVDDNLQGFKLSEDMHRLLEIRKALSMTSNKKYNAMIARANDDERVRDILLYHAASTGRDGGTGIQPHNFPRGLIKMSKDRPYATVENVAELDHEMLKILYGDSLGILFSALLRNMLIPSEGSEFFVADFSKVEVAVLWWLADNKPGLKILRDGLDPYKYQASANTGKAYIAIPEEGDERQLGKAQVLGCGFGMGWRKFKQAAWEMYRLKLTDKQSQEAVKKYREANKAVVVLWKLYEKAAIDVVKIGGVQEAGKCKFIYNPNKKYGGCTFLWVELPSGRRLAYADPEINWRVRQYERTEYFIEGVWVRENEDDLKNLKTRTVTETSSPMETLEFWAVNSKTKKWALERTWGGTLAENITQAVARDLMMPGMVRLEKRGYKALLMVHDEGICEREIGKGDVEEFSKILCEKPPWGSGLPVEAKGWRGPRYRKG